jgi:molybdate transport system ATP-binding protein
LGKRISDEKVDWQVNLEIRNLSLPLAHFVLEADFELRTPRTAIFGPSGAGKTSLLETIAGLRCPTTATIKLDEKIFENIAGKFSLPIRLRRIGYVPQDDSLFPHLSVRHNLLYGNRENSTDGRPALEHVIRFLQIKELLERDVRTLSRGENQRVVIGRALLSGPRLLLLDEPLTGLDSKLKDSILVQLRSLHHEFGVPILYVTHDRAEAVATCEEVLLLEAGKIVGRGNTAEVLGHG